MLGRLRLPLATGFVGPAFVLYAALVLGPGITAFGWALGHWDGLGERRWVGLLQFKRLLFEHDGFWQAMDTLRDKNHLEALWASGAAPWKSW